MLLYLTATAVPGSFYRVGELAGIRSNIRDGEEQGNIPRSEITWINIKNAKLWRVTLSITP